MGKIRENVYDHGKMKYIQRHEEGEKVVWIKERNDGKKIALS